MKKLITSFFLVLSVIFLVSCGQSTEKRVTGTYVATDGQTISLQDGGKVQYSDPANDDSSSGTWKIEDNKVIIDRETSSGTKRKQIFAEIPEGEIDSLFFSVVKGSSGRGNFSEQIFTKHK